MTHRKRKPALSGGAQFTGKRAELEDESRQPEWTYNVVLIVAQPQLLDPGAVFKIKISATPALEVPTNVRSSALPWQSALDP